jgi:Flp pilus assembly protein TadD
MNMIMQDHCPDDVLAQLVELAGRDEAGAIARIATLLEPHRSDPRLHFLEGSLLASQARYDEGRAAIARAVEIAPGFAIARFQLGLLELSSGDAEAADNTLRPLAEAESGDALVLFARGLRHLLRDEFAVAESLLRQGIAINRDHPPVNADMELILARIAEVAPAPAARDEDVSAAQMLLREHAAKSTTH